MRVLASATALPVLMALGLAGGTPATAQTVIDGGDTVTVPGDRPNPWNLAGMLTVGQFGDGTLIVENGGLVTAPGSTVILGSSAGSTGMVMVSGTGSSLEADFLVVANSGSGTMTIDNGGSVDMSAVTLGFAAGGAGTMRVSGAGSRVDAGGNLTVAAGGEATLIIEDGGVVNSSNQVVVGSAASSTGTVTVSGAASRFEGISLTLGSTGSGTMTVDNGGTVDMNTVTLGRATGSAGTMTISGVSSRVDMNSVLSIGERGNGDLTVGAGGTVSTTSTALVGRFAGSHGTLTVSGENAVFNANLLLVGFQGDGDLTISAGGRVTSRFGGAVGRDAGTTGSVMVTGAGSQWRNTGRVTIGSSGTATLTVSDGGRVTATEILVAETAGTGSVNIGAAAGSAATAAGTLTVNGIVFGDGTGQLVFNHTDTDFQLAAPISGAGAIDQIAGTSTLSGDSSGFSGATRVLAGSLAVNGQLGGAVDVASGARLAGTGTALGAVTVADGGTIAPGSGGTGTLTVGALSLSDASVLEYQLGSAGGTNDRIDVTGDLVLDGQLAITDVGGFGPGAYRLINYGGTLTDNGLEIGTVPAGTNPSDLFIQTAVANQVSLISTSGVELSFWDGGNPALYDNGAVDGGTGTWVADGRAWTDASGAVNGAYRPNPTFAMFQGTAGTVTVDDAAGAISVTGMQFSVNGYTVTGDSIDLAEANTVIRVGDGTAAGAGMRATIASSLTGTGGLNKTDFGTLTLSGVNSYTGMTTVSAGTLINRGTIAGAVTNDATLTNDAGGTAGAVTNSGTGSNAGTLASLINTAGTTTNTGAITGTVTVSGGTLDQNTGGSVAGTTTISGTGTVTNAGTLASVNNQASFINEAGGTTGAVTNSGTGSNAGTLASLINTAGTTTNTGTITGNVTNSAGTTTNTGSIGGTLLVSGGTLNQNSGGTLVGNTTITGGRLNATGTGTLSSAIVTIAGGTLFTDGGALLATADVAVNAGMFLVEGNEAIGTLTNAGTVAIGAGHTLAAMTIDNTTGTIWVGANATLQGTGNTLNNGSTINVATGGTVTDAGAINNLAAGAINFNGPGGTATLASTTAGAIVNDGTITIFSGDVAVTGDLTNQGAGLLSVAGGSMTGITTLTNTSTAAIGVGVAAGQTLSAETIVNDAGATIWNAATLTAMDTLTNTAGATLFSTGTLNGTVWNAGTIAATGTINGTLTNAGVFAPGGTGAIGTVTINGDFVQTAAGSLLIDVDGASGTNDRVTVTGTADLAGTVGVNLTGVDPVGLYTILSAAGGVTDSGLMLGAAPVFMNPLAQMELVFPNANDVALSFTFDTAAGSFDPNQASILNTINVINTGDVGDTGPMILALFGLGSTEDMASALDQLSPEIVLNTETASLFSAVNFTNSLFSCPVAGGAHAVIREGNCLWLRPQGRFLDVDRTAGRIGFEESVGGISIGGQYEVWTNWHAGFALGYERGDLDSNTGATADSDRFHAGGALKYQHGAMMIAGAVSGGIGAYDTTRTIGFGGLGAVNTADYDIAYVGAQLRAAYLMERGGFYAKPLVDVNLTYLDRGGFTEAGNPATALSVYGASETYLSVTPAIEIGSEHALPSGWIARTHLKAGVTFYSQDQNALTARFAGAPATAPSFQITSELDDVFADFEAGVTLLSGGNTSIELGYQGRISSGTSQHGGFIKGSLKF